MATLHVEVDDHKVQELLSKLTRKTTNLKPLFRNMAEEIYNSVMRNFETETDPEGNKWAPLSPKTLEHKRGTHILYETGNLMRSIHTHATNKEATVGTPVVYSRVMQFGWKERNIPARPYLGVSEKDWEKLHDIILRYLNR